LAVAAQGGAASAGGLAAALADEAVRSLRRSLMLTRFAAILTCVFVVAAGWVAINQLTSRSDASRAAEAAPAAQRSTLPPKTPGKLRVGYVVSKFTVSGPGVAFNGKPYTHAYPKVLPLVLDPTTEVWAVLEPGTAEDPGIAQIVETLFDGRHMDGSDAAQLTTCDVIVAAGIRNARDSVMRAIETAVRDSGVGLLLWVPIGGHIPGTDDPLMRRLNGLADGGRCFGMFSLDWLDCELVGTHPILGSLSDNKFNASAPKQLQFRPELMGPMAPDATPLVKLTSGDDAGRSSYPLYVSKLGRGNIVHFGFAPYTQIPPDFDRAVGGRFTLRCLYWLAGRSPASVPAAKPKSQTTRPAHAAPVATRK
jgi:hypothetical protein